MRHSTPYYSTKVRWGWGDLILERKFRGSRDPYKSVNMTDLPPVDLMATPSVRLTVVTHSPNLPYSEGIGSPAAAIPVLKVVQR